MREPLSNRESAWSHASSGSSEQDRFPRADSIARLDRHVQVRAPRHNQIHLRADADHAEGRASLDPLALAVVAVDAVDRTGPDLHDIAGKRRVPILTDEVRHRALVLHDVYAAGIVGRKVKKSAPVHCAHMGIFSECGMMAHEFNRRAERRAVEMHVEGTHKDADDKIRRVRILAQDVSDFGVHSLFDHDDIVSRRNLAYIDDYAVRGAKDPRLGRRRAGRISEEPQVAPTKIAASNERREDGGAYSRGSHSPSPNTRTSATPEENGKSMTSKCAFSRAITLSQRLTPAWRTSSRT